MTSITRLKRILEAIFTAFGVTTGCVYSSNLETLGLKWLATIALPLAFILTSPIHWVL